MTDTSPVQSETPQRTPSLGMSRRTSRHGSSSPAMSSSPPHIPPRGDFYYIENQDRANSNEEKISILDPRRFTPTLHASLVSEILSLRRELKSKINLVGGLEDNLHDATDENTKLSRIIATNAQESRFAKRQMELLEAGTMSALEDVTKERDVAKESLLEMRRLLELSQAKFRSEVEESERTHTLWDIDRQQWATEKRMLDRKVHMAEGRLKIILAEVEAARGMDQHQTSTNGEFEDHEVGDVHGKRSQSSASHYSNGTHDENEHCAYRFSHITGTKGNTFIGTTLAEELNFREENVADLDDSDIDAGSVSPEALPEEAVHQPRPFSAQSYRESSKARKILGLTAEEDEPTLREASQSSSQIMNAEQRAKWIIKKESVGTHYITTGTQFSPPISPTLKPQQELVGFTGLPEGCALDVSSKQDRVIYEDIPQKQPLLRDVNLPRIVPMISQACQTNHQPFNLTETPVISEVAKSGSDRPSGSAEMTVASTQTEEGRVPGELKDIPIIAIHPPVTDPSTSRKSVVLPPQTKNVACQVNIHPPLRCASVQTEEIRVDNRPVKLPPHLLPSSISSDPAFPGLTELQEVKGLAPKGELPQKAAYRPREVHPKQAPIFRKDTVPGPTEDAYPGNNDNGLLSHVISTGPRRPIRAESLFAGFDNSNDNVVNNGTHVHNDASYSDDSCEDKEPIRKTLSKVQNSWKLIPQTEDSINDRLESMQDVSPVDVPDDQESLPVSAQTTTSAKGLSKRRVEKVPRKQSVRRAALISNGTLAHVQQPRSPATTDKTIISTTSSGPVPPFPVPIRASSRRIPVSVSEGAPSPTPQSTSFFSGQTRKESGIPSIRRPVLRKIRSAAATAQSPHGDGHRKRFSPPPTPDLCIPQSPRVLPPLSKDDVASPRREKFELGVHHQSSTGTEAAVRQTSVVDAIAQTMIGEWMWKYVRKRKSFGMSDSPAADFESSRSGNENGSVNGARHKRWVWLAPYERAIMWSSKIPNSGSALLGGKSGRKLAIQSVLDVRDDAPMPKNADAISAFGRSILILTPQRALKFTATTKERHYVWLAALSFLSHSTLGEDDLLTTLPPVPPKEYHRPADQRSTAVLRRIPIRDSIRLAKGESRPETKGRRGYTTPPNELLNEYTGHFERHESAEAAEPPLVPRFTTVTRHRSNTGSKAVPCSSYSAFPTINKPSNRSLTTASSETFQLHSFATERPGQNSALGSLLKRTRGKASSYNSEIEANNFFDAIGTVRMEAFVDRNTRTTENDRVTAQKPRLDYAQEKAIQKPREVEKKPPRGSYRTRQGRKKDMSYWGSKNEVSRIEAVLRDPFEGF